MGRGGDGQIPILALTYMCPRLFDETKKDTDLKFGTQTSLD